MVITFSSIFDSDIFKTRISLVLIIPNNCLSSKCENGLITCKTIANCGTCPGNQVWAHTSSKGLCLKTCENLHLPCLYSTAKGGCHCANDTVWDSSISRCVLAGQCPCKMNGKSYADGYVINKDCNEW